MQIFSLSILRSGSKAFPHNPMRMTESETSPELHSSNTLLMIVRTGGGDSVRRGERAEAERDRESVYLSFSSPDSDREQTAEDNEKQICGREEEEGGRRSGLGEGEYKNKKKGEERGE